MVGKKELEKDPLARTLGQVMDAAFIDREDSGAAVEGLRKVEELARKGLSILVAPEGTRLDTTEVGPFKKGPFRMAMSVGIPIVPIVIRNAEVVAARDSATFNPGEVDVVVYPPISVEDWTLDNLPDRIDEVRQLYLDTLADWPRGAVPEVRIGAGAKSGAVKKATKIVPAKKASGKKTTAKPAAAKKPAAKSAAAKKATTTPKKSPTETATKKKATAKKVAAKIPTAKTPTAKSAPAQKPASPVAPAPAKKTAPTPVKTADGGSKNPVPPQNSAENSRGAGSAEASSVAAEGQS